MLKFITTVRVIWCRQKVGLSNGVVGLLVYCTSPFIFIQAIADHVYMKSPTFSSLNRSTCWCSVGIQNFNPKICDKMTNQITPLSSTICPNKAWGKCFILEPVQFKPAILYDYKIHKYNKITFYTRLTLQTIKTNMYTETVVFEGSVFVPRQGNGCFAPHSWSTQHDIHENKQPNLHKFAIIQLRL